MKFICILIRDRVALIECVELADYKYGSELSIDLKKDEFSKSISVFKNKFFPSSKNTWRIEVNFLPGKIICFNISKGVHVNPRKLKVKGFEIEDIKND